ncbi:MAG: ribulose bisphosphate carboxylase small subunit [Acidimicrobiales bacterium]
MRLTQGTFSYLPDLTDEELAAQLRYALGRGWALAVEHTDDPHPRNVYWELWELPMFDLADPETALRSIRTCRGAFPDRYVRVVAYDPGLGRHTTALSVVVQRPSPEPSFRLARQEAPGRRLAYTIRTAEPTSDR